MNAPEILANMSRGWNRDPSGVAQGTEPTGISAALWTCANDDIQELSTTPSGTHIVSVQQRPFLADTFLDGRLAYSMRHIPGMVSMVRAGLTPRAVTRGSFGILHLYLPAAMVQAVADLCERPVSGMVELIDPANTRDTTIAGIGREVLAEMRENQPLSRLRIDALGQDLAVQLLRRYSNLSGTRAASRKPRKGGLAPYQLKRVTDRMLSALQDDVSLAELAVVAELSPAHFCTSFRHSTGLPPHRWLLERRMERAKELLVDPHLSLTEIALEVGYSGQGPFGAAFRRVTGTTPSAWRRGRLL